MRAPRAGLVLAFAGLGASGAGVPASVPAMAAALQAPVGQALAGVPLLFAGLFAGVLATPPLARHAPLPRVVALGAGVQALALPAAAAAPSAGAFVLACALVGLGFGTVESAGAVLARAVAPQGTARLLTGLTACVAAVAALAPLLVAALVPGPGPRAALALLAVPHVAAVLVLARGTTGLRATDDQVPVAVRPSVLRPVVPAAAALFLFVGVESTLAGWSAELPRRQLGLGAATAALGTSAFWVLLALGRLLAWGVLHAGRDPRRLLTASLRAAAVLLAAAAALASWAPWPALAATGAAVVACGPCYALLLGAGVQAADPGAAAAVSAGLVAAGALGGATLAALGSTVAGTLDVPATLPCAVAAALAVVAARSAGRLRA